MPSSPNVTSYPKGLAEIDERAVPPRFAPPHFREPHLSGRELLNLRQYRAPCYCRVDDSVMR